MSQFVNERLTDFAEESNRQSLQAALVELQQSIRMGIEARPIIGGTIVTGEVGIERRDPSDRSVVVGTVFYATETDTHRAVATARDGALRWSLVPVNERAATLTRVARRMRDRKGYLTALIIRECGKPWKEADGDVAEAIDFCEYYAREALRLLSRPQLTQAVLGEENLYLYQPRGVCAVIAPWNFPLAIACGMATAALVTGNTVVFKPAEQSSLIGFALAQILLECGVPGDCFQFLPGDGEAVGKILVDHTLVDMIAFTGSRPVGFEIIRSAGQVRPGQHSVKRVIAELGGKNAIIVDEDADMDDAIRGVITSAFGYAGQKCSACSRLIVVGSAYDSFLERLGSAMMDLLVGPASESSTFVGPVIDEEAHTRILSTIARGKNELKILAETPVAAELMERGNYIPPTVFRDVAVSHDVWREEIFGPVLACAKASNFDEAIRMAVESDYALTGGVFSRHPRHLEQAKMHFKVGNLYINRGITGALVERQPFGGFKFSGIGSKAGGPDYLLQFLEPRVITENTVRRGFSPDLG